MTRTRVVCPRRERVSRRKQGKPYSRNPADRFLSIPARQPRLRAATATVKGELCYGIASQWALILYYYIIFYIILYYIIFLYYIIRFQKTVSTDSLFSTFLYSLFPDIFTAAVAFTANVVFSK